MELICNWMTWKDIAPSEFEEMMPFMKDLKDKFDQSDLLLSVTFAVTPYFKYNWYNYTTLSNNVDFLSFSIIFDLSAFVEYRYFPMYQAFKSFQLSNIQEIIEQIIESGGLPEKIVAALDFRGFGFHEYGPGIMYILKITNTMRFAHGIKPTVILVWPLLVII